MYEDVTNGDCLAGHTAPMRNVGSKDGDTGNVAMRSDGRGGRISQKLELTAMASRNGDRDALSMFSIAAKCLVHLTVSSFKLCKFCCVLPVAFI